MRDVVVDGSALTVDDVVAVARGQARVKLGDDVPKRMEKSRSVVVEALRGDAPVYGVNTGFGALGAAITSRMFELGWLERGQRRRSVRVTPAGIEGLASTFGVDLP